MKLTRSKKQDFTMEDFEKGLMLAGLITPSSISELQEREALEEYECSLKNNKNNKYFKRVALAAEIVNNLYNEPTLGSVKFQKLIYLCEHAAEMDLNNRYSKQAAGPFDNRFMHSIASEFKKHQWFDVQKIQSGNINRSVFKPLENCENYKVYYNSYFSDCNNKIQYIIDLFRRTKTDQTEIVATLYACAIELNENKKNITKENLLEIFYNWSEAKKRFSGEQVIKSWEWMEERGITP